MLDKHERMFCNNIPLNVNGVMGMRNTKKENQTFEDIRHIDEKGVEFWYARKLMSILEYSNWQNFEKIVKKAKISCENSDISVLDHFINVNKMVLIGSGAYREQTDYKLSRYACYLIAQKGNCFSLNIFCSTDKETGNYRKRIQTVN